MTEFALLALAVLAALTLFGIVTNIADTVENIRIAKHTGRDPRPPRKGKPAPESLDGDV